MTLATTPEHRELAAVVSRFVEREKLVEVAHRALVEGPAAYDAVWKAIQVQGWLGLPVPEEFGGQGFGLAETAVVVHGLAAGLVPGALIPSVAAAATIAQFAPDDVRARLLPTLCDGSRTAAVALGTRDRDASDLVERPVIGAAMSDLHLIRRGQDVHVHDGVAQAAASMEGLDPALGCVPSVAVCAETPGHSVLAGAGPYLQAVMRTLAACEAAGGAAHVLEMALEHAKSRRQFGRVIGGFQAIKHHLAEMRMRSELATAAAWGAARLGGHGEEGVLSSAVAAAVALPAFEANARKAHQVLGGMGFTWEHDAHLFLRRATSWSVLLGAGAGTDDDVYGAVADGVEARWQVDLPPEAEGYRSQVQDFVAQYRETPEERRRALLVESGYLVPHWPKPWGRGAGPVEQLVIEEGIRSLRIPDLDINGWVLLTLVQSASPEQLERWIVPGLLGTATWCQMFSEPEAGSDAAAVRTKGVRSDGGWLVSGQKMWTTGAHESAWGLATVRTDPRASKHAGLTMMAIDLSSPGVTIRPIREMTGGSTVNEVFLDDVFVPDSDVVAGEGRGWEVARATLSNERVSIGGRRALGYQARDLVPLLKKYSNEDPHLRRELGRLLAREFAMELINVRQVESLLADVERTDLGSLTKVVSSEHLQAVTELGVRLVGVTGAEPQMLHEFLFNRCLTIAGGSSEIGRNVVGERLLGLPREIQPANPEAVHP